MMLGADVSIGRLLVAIVLATLGNIAGGVMLATLYWWALDPMAKMSMRGRPAVEDVAETTKTAKNIDVEDGVSDE